MRSQPTDKKHYPAWLWYAENQMTENSTTLISRLRIAGNPDAPRSMDEATTDALYLEAADEIERLRYALAIAENDMRFFRDGFVRMEDQDGR